MSVCPQILEVELDFDVTAAAEDDVADLLTPRPFCEGLDVRIENVTEPLIAKRISVVIPAITIQFSE